MRKRLISTLAGISIALSACGTTGTTTGTTGTNQSTTAISTATTIGMNVFKSSVDSRCRGELQKQQAWRLARVAMTAQQELQIENKICGCVSEKAPQYVTVVDITNGALDPAYRTQVVTKVVTQTLQACYADFVN